MTSSYKLTSDGIDSEIKLYTLAEALHARCNQPAAVVYTLLNVLGINVQEVESL